VEPAPLRSLAPLDLSGLVGADNPPPMSIVVVASGRWRLTVDPKPKEHLKLASGSNGSPRPITSTPFLDLGFVKTRPRRNPLKLKLGLRPSLKAYEWRINDPNTRLNNFTRKFHVRKFKRGTVFLATLGLPWVERRRVERPLPCRFNGRSLPCSSFSNIEQSNGIIVTSFRAVGLTAERNLALLSTNGNWNLTRPFDLTSSANDGRAPPTMAHAPSELGEETFKPKTSFPSFFTTRDDTPIGEDPNKGPSSFPPFFFAESEDPLPHPTEAIRKSFALLSSLANLC